MNNFVLCSFYYTLNFRLILKCHSFDFSQSHKYMEIILAPEQ